VFDESHKYKGFNRFDFIPESEVIVEELRNNL